MELRVQKATGLRKVRGLIGKKSAEAILLKTRFGIHTIGVRFPIDVVILDKNNTVRVLKKSLKPNSLFFWPIRYTVVLELPDGMIREKEIEVGEKLHLLFDQS